MKKKQTWSTQAKLSLDKRKIDKKVNKQKEKKEFIQVNQTLLQMEERVFASK